MAFIGMFPQKYCKFYSFLRCHAWGMAHRSLQNETFQQNSFIPKFWYFSLQRQEQLQRSKLFIDKTTLSGSLWRVFDIRLKDRILERFLWLQHLFVNHILLYEAAFKSKFLPKFVCVEELYKLFKLTIRCSIEINTTRHKHQPDSAGILRNVIYYRATFPEAICTFEHPQHEMLYQLEVMAIYKHSSFINGFGYGDGYTVSRLKKEFHIGSTPTHTTATSPLPDSPPQSHPLPNPTLTKDWKVLEETLGYLNISDERATISCNILSFTIFHYPTVVSYQVWTLNSNQRWKILPVAAFQLTMFYESQNSFTAMVYHDHGTLFAFYIHCHICNPHLLQQFPYIIYFSLFSWPWPDFHLQLHLYISKPVRRGVKICLCCDGYSNYCQEFHIHLGKGSTQPSRNSALFDIVWSLLEKIQRKNHVVYFNNLFTSVVVAKFLYSKQFPICGMMRARQKYIPEKV